ncbi:PREDICTED: mitochondrial inner membrane protease subunit 1 [Polistes canadensis]|uniref:mitochondrial inner membrane protease subunit 1 n=1 Tax=Polistes canadensis TaxID=91411 RepID=UPI000718D9D8|nr:PREDICTED: mitochondrial inner membrane protease subunit 1 [Polistes canadensis]
MLYAFFITKDFYKHVTSILLVIMFSKHIYKVLSVLGVTLQYACITHCAFEYIGEFVVCSGPSMEPTIRSKDILFTEHISTKLRWYKKGDIVISICPSNPRQHICKRLVGLPGDSIRHGFFTYTVPIGHVWLEGDNSSNSADSRIYGPVPQGLLRGRAICKIWPLSDVTLFTTKL